MKFTLQITLGNDAVETKEDISGILQVVTDVLAVYGDIPPQRQDIRDYNGNVVGSWAFTEDREDILRKFAMPKPSETGRLIS